LYLCRDDSICIFFFFFFFSSRRRHTRSKRDWSSDVCSSDLFSIGANCSSNHLASSTSQGMGGRLTARISSTRPAGRKPRPCLVRSEERRVGKEGRAECER